MNIQAKGQRGECWQSAPADAARAAIRTVALIATARNGDIAPGEDEGIEEGEGDDEDEEQPNYDHLPPLKRPRKKVYKSTLRKRNREKKRRDHFNEGLEQLAELVFEVDPTIASGRDDHIIVHDGKSTTITNRGDLMESAVFVMRRLLREHSEQKAAISKLSGALAEATANCEFLSARANLAPPGAGLSGSQGLVPIPSGRGSMNNTTTGDQYALLTGSNRDKNPTNVMLPRQGISINLPMNNNGASHSMFLGSSNPPRVAAASNENPVTGVMMPHQHHGMGFNLLMNTGASLLGNNSTAHRSSLGNQLYSTACLARGPVHPHGSPAASFLQSGRLSADLAGGMPLQQQLSSLSGPSQNHYIFPPNNSSLADFAPSSVDINIESPTPALTTSLDQQQQHLILVGGPQEGRETAAYYDQEEDAQSNNN